MCGTLCVRPGLTPVPWWSWGLPHARQQHASKLVETATCLCSGNSRAALHGSFQSPPFPSS